MTRPSLLLSLEHLTVLMLCALAFFVLGGPLWLFALLLFAPDLGMVGSVAGPRVGAVLYNVLHIQTPPLLLGAWALFAGDTPALWVALVWLLHIEMDRLIGYGLKYPTAFTDTHLSTLRAGQSHSTPRPS